MNLALPTEQLLRFEIDVLQVHCKKTEKQDEKLNP